MKHKKRKAKKVSVLSPPLKWAGGKRWLLPHLSSVWADHSRRRLVEPFCGGLAVALGLEPNKVLLNDINDHLINFYRWLQRGLRVAFIEMKYDKDLYYSHRKKFNELIEENKADIQTAAELFYYLNRTGYNGLCRFNSKGGFNVPFGRHKNINYIEDFTPYSELLSRWEFSNLDFESLSIKSGDFIYADPPYDVQFREYSKGGFSWEDQVRLARWLGKHPGPVIASNQATERVVELYGDLGFHISILKGPRRVSCTGDRTPAKEMLACKNIIQA